MCGFSLARRILFACALTLALLAGGAAAEQNESLIRPLQHGAIASGGAHVCVIDGADLVHCWGQDASGQLGDGGPASGDDAPAPATPLVFDRPARALALGAASSCVLLADGSVRCWGSDSEGQLGNGPPLEAVSSPSVPVLPAAQATAIAGGGTHACALVVGGGVRCWGSDAAGQLGDGGAVPGTDTPVPAPLIALGQPAMAIAGGGQHTCAILAIGAVRCWGADADGQLGDGDAGDASSAPSAPVALEGPARAIAAGGASTCALLADGGVRCWGADDKGQLGNGGGLPGADSATPVAVELGQPAQGIGVGAGHACALLVDGTVRCWGSNASGQLGDGGPVPGATASGPSTPVALPQPARAVTVGDAGACALLADGTLHCWGADNDGQLGDGVPAKSRSGPAAVALPSLGSPDSADLSLAAQASAPTAHAGQAVTITLTLANAGIDAAGAEVAGGLAGALALVAATPSQGSYDASTGRWSAGALAPGASATLTLTATATAPGAAGATAEIASSSARDPDSTPNNGVAVEDDRAAVALTVAAAPVVLAKVAPRMLTLRLAPARDRRAPYAFAVRGRLAVPRAALREGCAGTVAVTARAGRRAVATRRVPLRLGAGRCTYSARMRFVRRPQAATRLAIIARFTGNAHLTGRASRPATIRLG